MKLSGKSLDITGTRFNRLLARKPLYQDRRGNIIWQCKCDCGRLTKVPVSALRNKHTRSCGCLQRETAIRRCTKHGRASSPEYLLYWNAKQRCENTKSTEYCNYGGRGIQFKFTSFEEFFKCVGERPTKKYSLDRINNNGHYEKNNVRWVTMKTQNLNKRIHKCVENFSDNEIKKEFIRRGLCI